MTLPENTIHPADQPGGIAASGVGSANEANDALVASLQTLIAQQPFFKGLNSRQLHLLAESALLMNFESGQAILAEGSPANRFYLILEGKVALETELKERGQRIPIQTLGPGDELGWSWLFPPHSLHFSAHAIEPTRTIFFFAPRLQEQCEQDHELGYELMKRIAEVATESLQAVQLRLVEALETNRRAPG